jgi:cyclopropane-fatty-acyl-phospholipid synthase
MTRREDVIALYARQVNGVHRYNTEEFYQLEAREKLFHLGSGASALDFGCGSADLLAYYAPQFDTLVGVDISDMMLARTAERLRQMGVANVTLRQADDLTVWPWLAERRFDVITSAAVMQYFSPPQIGAFLANAHAHVAPGGRVVMFDLVDPRVYWPFKYGWFSAKPMNAAQVVHALARSVKMLALGLAKALGMRPRADLMGAAHHPAVIKAQAEAAGYSVNFVRSIYYEYRYHALLTPR